MAMAAAYSTFGGMMIHENRGGTKTAYVGDTLGSVTKCLDSGGNESYNAEYWPYGEVRTESGSNPSSWSFVGLLGYFRDLLEKLFYVRARHYTPAAAGWLCKDSLWPRLRAYTYVAGNVVSSVDPSGTVSHRVYAATASLSGCGGHPLRYTGGLTPCVELLTEGLDDLPQGFLECLRNLDRADTGEGARNCICQYWEKLKDLELDNIIAFISCWAAANLNSNLQNPHRDPCGDTVHYSWECCYERYLSCLLKCVHDSKDEVGLGACLEGCRLGGGRPGKRKPGFFDCLLNANDYDA